MKHCSLTHFTPRSWFGWARVRPAGKSPYGTPLLVPAFNYPWSAVAPKHQVHRDHLLKRKGPHSLVTAMVFTALRYYCLLLWFFISCCVGSMLKLNRSGWCSCRNNLSVGSDTLQGSKEKGFGRNSDTMLYKYNPIIYTTQRA